MMNVRKKQAEPLVTHLTFHVYELGKHQRRIEGQLSYIVVVLFSAHWLWGERGVEEEVEQRQPLTDADEVRYNLENLVK